jgi:predicted DNA-binding protein YlxM (UPF0122 family)
MTASRQERIANELGIEGATDVTADIVDRYDRQYWALYRTLDVSQAEVAELFDTRIDTSQSTVSRAIKECDTRVLTEGDLLQLGGDFSTELLSDDLRDEPDEWFEAYRDVLAEATTDRLALNILVDRVKPKREWAARRFPELVGCHYPAARHFGFDDEDIAPVDHLSHLESVNIERWR